MRSYMNRAAVLLPEYSLSNTASVGVHDVIWFGGQEADEGPGAMRGRNPPLVSLLLTLAGMLLIFVVTRFLRI